jgi:hypothetical protein
MMGFFGDYQKLHIIPFDLATGVDRIQSPRDSRGEVQRVSVSPREQNIEQSRNS